MIRLPPGTSYHLSPTLPSQLISSPLLPFYQIGNACGTQGLIHALANSPAKSHISPDSPLSNLISQAKSLTPLQRSELLATSKELEEAHSVSAQGGQSIVPDAESRVNLHFTAFVRHPENGSLIELDGRRKGVKVRDVKVEKQKDLLKDTAAFVQKQYVSSEIDVWRKR